MKTDFIEELRWRGLLHSIMPGTEDLLKEEKVSGYIGFDPTSDSLHIGSLTQILTLMRLQKAGHKPYALIGGATGMVGDPSGKSAERNLLDADRLQANIRGIQQQLEKFLDFSSPATGAVLVNNYDWMKEYSFLEFIRDIGKYITVNYMMAKDSVKNRITRRFSENEGEENDAADEEGMSFTEFSYQLLQAYDFYYLWKHHNVKLQMGGTDQYGNITTGTQLIRRKASGKAFGLTTKLVNKADGTKFGKSESGNIWLDRNKTSPYKFYQFWFNTSDNDVENYLRIFTFIPREEIEALEAEHKKDKGKRILQRRLARELTVMVHSEVDYNTAVEASNALFQDGLSALISLEETVFNEVFEGVPGFTVGRAELETTSFLDLLVKGNVCKSKTEAKQAIQGGGIRLNKEKVSALDLVMNKSHLVKDKYIVLQKGKRDYFLCTVI